jgi:phosphocarrier protein
LFLILLFRIISGIRRGDALEKKLIIKNKYGLHARPAAQFVEVAAHYDADVTLTKDGVEVNGKSIMGVLMLAAEKGHEVILKTSGNDEHELAEALTALLEGKFNEE